MFTPFSFFTIIELKKSTVFSVDECQLHDKSIFLALEYLYDIYPKGEVTKRRKT